MAVTAFTGCGEKEKTAENAVDALMEGDYSEAEEDLYSYYELLNAEYEAVKPARTFQTGMTEDKVFFIADSGYYIYDIGSNEPAKLHSSHDDENEYNNWVYSNDYVYAASTETDSVYRMDLNGNILFEKNLDVSLGWNYELHLK